MLSKRIFMKGALSVIPEQNLEAYRILYKLENHLRYLTDNYNFAALKINRPVLSEYIYVLHKIKKMIDDDVANRLYKLVSIRNKVCHMQPITDEELEYVYDCWYSLQKEKPR